MSDDSRTPGPYYFDYCSGVTGGDVIGGPSFRYTYRAYVKLEVAHVAELLNHAHEYQERKIRALVEELRFVRQTVHQAHHEGPIEECSKNTCSAATHAIAKAESKL